MRVPDALQAQLQAQADLLNGKIQRRREELAITAAIPPEQRAANRTAAIENLGIKVASLQAAEKDYKSQLDEAAAKAASLHKARDDARLADVQKEEKGHDKDAAEQAKQAAMEVLMDKENAYKNCITVGGPPATQWMSVTQVRKKILLAGSVAAWFVFGLLIIGELKRPALVTSVRPDAAPRVNPPVRVFPWPQPQQLQGLKSRAPSEGELADAERMLGM